LFVLGVESWLGFKWLAQHTILARVLREAVFVLVIFKKVFAVVTLS